MPGKDRFKCRHCGTIGTLRTQKKEWNPLRSQNRFMGVSTCRDTEACNTRLRAATATKRRREAQLGEGR